MACREPRGRVGRRYEKDHYTLLHTKYECSGPCGFGEVFFSIVSLWELITPGVGSFLTPGAWLAELLRGPLYIATHKIEKLWALWFWRRFFLCFPHCKSIGANDPHCKSVGVICCHGNQSSDLTWPKN